MLAQTVTPSATISADSASTDHSTKTIGATSQQCYRPRGQSLDFEVARHFGER